MNDVPRLDRTFEIDCKSNEEIPRLITEDRQDIQNICETISDDHLWQFHYIASLSSGNGINYLKGTKKLKKKSKVK